MLLAARDNMAQLGGAGAGHAVDARAALELDAISQQLYQDTVGDAGLRRARSSSRHVLHGLPAWAGTRWDSG